MLITYKSAVYDEYITIASEYNTWFYYRGLEYESSLSGKQQLSESEHKAK